MKSLINRYLQAWEQENLQELQEILHPKFKGIRTFFEEVIFDFYALEAAVDNPVRISYEVYNTQEFQTYTTVDATMHLGEREHEVTFKFIFKDDLIYQVYETKKLIGLKRIKCIISYDGSIYNGYQKQPDELTVQGAIEKALKEALNEEISIHASGRTDKGVHAYNQVIHFDTSTSIPGENIYKVVNKYLPDSIHIKSSMEVHETFHSRYDIIEKEYLYKINLESYDVIQRDYEWYPGPFDLTLFQKELKSIIGRYDFTAFTKTIRRDNYRTIYNIEFKELGPHFFVSIKGNGFLRYMVRNIIGYAMAIAQGKEDKSLFEIIESKDNNLIKEIAPAGGLYMKGVTYHV